MRLIDADELITAFPCGESVRTESVRATINNMPTIPSTATDTVKALREAEYHGYMKAVADRPQGEWIPCSERLPEKDGSYLVCMSWNYHSMDVLMWADGWNCTRHINGEANRESEIDGTDIIAWMPLPEPWKGERR